MRRFAAFKSVWAGIGSSIVVVGGDGLWNCHIHSDDIGAAVEAALDVGRPRHPCHRPARPGRGGVVGATRAAELDAHSTLSAEEPVPVTSVVAVATGDGIRRIFYSLGVHHIVAGGQSMNPSTEQILEVVESVPGAEVVILPNNKNIVPVAEQACELSSKPTFVVNTPGIQEGFAALLDYDPEATGAENASAMRAAAGRVRARGGDPGGPCERLRGGPHRCGGLDRALAAAGSSRLPGRSRRPRATCSPSCSVTATRS